MGGAVTGGVWTSAALGTWGKPPDDVAWVALGIAAALALLATMPRAVREAIGLEDAADRDQRRRFVSGCAFVAAFLSLGYVAFYLRGGSRIIDATSYFLEGRAFAHGQMGWPLPGPTASFRGRFLLFHDPDSLSVIFPPGYPLLLAAGFLVGAPMVIGPFLAGLLVIATYVLAHELCEPDDPNAHAVGALAAVFSIACAALRYHTADTMAHGASALGITVALTCALRGRRTGSIKHFALAGLATGWVMATRPVSSVPIAITVFALCVVSARGAKALGAAVALLVPGIVLLCVSQKVGTGSWFSSTQEAYYATSDGPPGCFRYGFGRGVGCLYEHGDFVKDHLTSGYGPLAALGTTGRRLKMHLQDVLNFEPLFLLVLWPLAGRLRSKAGLALAVVFGQVLVYAPFYFDGNYPGGGARFFADVLPIEHVLAAMGVALVLPRVALARRGLLVLALSFAGFAVHAVFDHIALAERDGGRPMFEPDVAKDAQATHGILFFETDHGFNLAYVPGADPEKEVLAARMRGDDHDRLLLERLNRPQTRAYRLGDDGPSVTPWVPSGGSADFWRFEAEADWPPLAQSGGWAEPVWMNGTCASQERALTLRPSGTDRATATIDLPVASTGRWLVTPRIIRTNGSGHGSLRLVPVGRAASPDDDKLVWEWADGEATGEAVPHETCAELVPRETVLLGGIPGTGARWILTATGGDVSLDRTTLKLLQ
jgi:hypothetical protein